MCFILDIKSFPRIALKDIKVKKLFLHTKDKYVTPYRKFEYEKGVVYKSKLKLHCPSIYEMYIDEGLHSYTDKTEIDSYASVDSHYNVKINGRWCSLYTFEYNGVCVKECIIPKGSIYFVNKEGEVVSNRLRLI